MNTSVKVGILTFHRAINYGAILQTYALGRALEKVGARVEVIDYRAPFNEKRFMRKPMRELFRPRTMYSVLFRNSYMRFDRSRFEHFYTNLRFSKPCSTRTELEEVSQMYDKIVCGSDQIWNLACTEGDNSYFLPFVADQRKKNAYAASFGYEALPDKFESACRDYLESFSSISVREKSGVKIVDRLIHRQPAYVVDPTLLLQQSEWLELADFNLIPSKPYVLLYLMSEDKELICFAKRLAKNKGCKLLYIHDRLFSLKGATNLRRVTPEQWLGLIARAAYICTNSFHGTVFSINFNKQFFVKYIPRSIANTRLECVLTEYGLANRLTNSWDQSECDFFYASKKLGENRQVSMQYIKKIIEGTYDRQ